MSAYVAGEAAARVARSSPSGPMFESLAVAVLGIDAAGPSRLPDNPRLLRAFTLGSRVRTVELGPGLWSAVRTSADGTVHVLCVHNIGDEPRIFAPGPVLPGALGELVQFIRGEMSTRPDDELDADGEALCELPAYGFAWLARFHPGEV